MKTGSALSPLSEPHRAGGKTGRRLCFERERERAPGENSADPGQARRWEESSFVQSPARQHPWPHVGPRRPRPGAQCARCACRRNADGKGPGPAVAERTGFRALASALPHLPLKVACAPLLRRWLPDSSTHSLGASLGLGRWSTAVSGGRRRNVRGELDAPGPGCPVSRLNGVSKHELP